MRPALLIAAVLALLAAQPAMAKPDRAGARGLAAASKQLRTGILAQKGPLETALLRTEQDPACDQAIRNVPFSESDTRAFEAAADLLITYRTEALLWPVRVELARFSADLAKVRLRDPVLRSGRAAQRRLQPYYTRLGEPPADICARLDAWRQAGYVPEQAPLIEDPALDELFASSKKIQRLTKKVDKAGRRLRALGVSKRVRNYWSLDNGSLFKGIDTGSPSLPIAEANGG